MRTNRAQVMSTTPQFRILPLAGTAVVVWFVSLLWTAVTVAQEATQGGTAEETAATAEETAPIAASADDDSAATDASSESTSAGDESGEGEEEKLAAWEFRPYNVAVWIVDDRGAWIESTRQDVVQEIERRCRISDPTSWNVSVIAAPRPWRGRLFSAREHSRWTEDLILSARTIHGNRIDKVIIVNLDEVLGTIGCTVQELDIKTRIWGPRMDRRCTASETGMAVYDGIRRAFMPIALIDKIHELEVLVRVRGSGIVWVPETQPDGSVTMVQNTSSPAWVDDDEILLPVILRSDRLGNVDPKEGITHVDHTYLAIEAREDPHLRCHTWSMRRAPLGGRSGGRTERVALCVRAPERDSVVRMVSNDKEPVPLRDLEVYSRLPGQPEEEDSEFLGKTDWQGRIEVPSNERGFRILYVKSGERPLARVPVVPGYIALENAPMPNDYQRLFAEGIVKGYRNEINDLVARRLILETRIRMAMEKNDIDKADGLLTELRRIDDNRQFNSRLSLEKRGLLNASGRQKEYIEGMFAELEEASNKYLDAYAVTVLSRMLRDLKAGEPVDFTELDRLKEEGAGTEGDPNATTDEAADGDDTASLVPTAVPV